MVLTICTNKECKQYKMLTEYPFCKDCGNSTVPAPTCAHCKSVLSKYDKYCGKCGTTNPTYTR